MAYEMKPLSCSPSQLKGFSEKLIVSHYENNYGGAVELGTASILIGAGALGVLLFHSRAKGALALCAVIAGAAVFHLGFAPVRALLVAAGSGGLFDIGAFFLTVGAFSFGGGLSMIAFIQDQVVNQYQWLTQREFIDGLALGQLTPGPILMVLAYVGYKLAGIAGAGLATAPIFLPAFILMLSILRIFDRVRQVVWMSGRERHQPRGHRRAAGDARADGSARAARSRRRRDLRSGRGSPARLERRAAEADARRRAARAPQRVFIRNPIGRTNERPAGGNLALKRSDVAALLGMRECIDAVEAAFREHADGKLDRPGILGMHVPAGSFHVKAASLDLLCGEDERQLPRQRRCARAADDPGRHSAVRRQRRPSAGDHGGLGRSDRLANRGDDRCGERGASPSGPHPRSR